MNVKAIKTPIVKPGDELMQIILSGLPELHEKQVVIITSKIIALCQNRVIPKDSIDKEALIKKEADLYLPENLSSYNYHFSIKNNTLVAAAGIDESNGKDIFILWPSDIQKSANQIRAELMQKYNVSQLGVIISDSVSQPLRRGTTGITLGYSGFRALNDYRTKHDLFNQEIKVTQSNIAGGLTAAAVVTMGEGSEQTPICTISDIPFVEFVSDDPSVEELTEYYTSLDDDLFAPFLKTQPWEKYSH